jgi:ADP-heptose:LPS heptosyltransferase
MIQRTDLLAKTQQGVLVIMTDYHLGDFAIALPVIEALASHFDDGIDLAVFGAHAPLIQMLPSAAKIRILAYHTQRKARDLRQTANFLKLAFRLMARRYPVTIGLSDRIACATFALAAGSPRRIGRTAAKRSWVYNDRLAADRPERHRLDAFSTLLTRIGIQSRPALPRLRLSPSSQEKACSLVARQWGPGRPYAVIHPTAGKPSRQWPLDRFAAVADRLVADRDLDLCVIGGPSEARSLQALVDRMACPSRATVVTEALDVSLSLIRFARLFVCNFSGPTHLASLTADTPIVCISGPTDREYWRPLGNPHVKLLHGPVCSHKCRREACTEGFRCVLEVTVDDVIHAAEEFLASSACRP